MNGSAAVVAIILAAALAPSSGAGAGDDRAALARLEDRWVDALERRDVAAVGTILAEDFVDTTYRGERRSRGEALAALTSPSRVETTQRLSELDVRIYGNVGVVSGINTVTARGGAFTVRVRFTDVFVRRRGVWKAVSAQETLVEGGRG